MNRHDLFNHLPTLAFVFQVWMTTIPKSSSASGLSPALPPDSGMPSLRCWEILILLQLFAENSKLTCFQTSDCTIINLFTFFSVCVFCFCLSCPGKETAPVCAMSIAFPWMFECSANWQSSSSSSLLSPPFSCMAVKHVPACWLWKKDPGFQTKCLRKHLCISYLEHKTSDWVQSKIKFLAGKLEHLPATVKRWKLAWFRHVTRHDRLSKTILQGILEGGRHCG